MIPRYIHTIMWLRYRLPKTRSVLQPELWAPPGSSGFDRSEVSLGLFCELGLAPG
jgi:hypothetical protein